MFSPFSILLMTNALGLIVLTLLFIGYIRIMGRYKPNSGDPDKQNGGPDDENGGGGYDPRLPKLDLPPGSRLSDWQTDRIETPKKSLITAH